MSGLEQSEILVAKLVAKLADNGVAPTETRAGDYFEQVDREKVKLFIHLIDWLLSEGVIRRVREPKGDGFGRVWFHKIVLTSRGFQLLASQFSPDLTLSQAVRKANAAGGNYSGLGDFLGGLLGGFSKSVANQ